ncbi:hypothetical protein SAMN02745132_04724 [Enterovibrio nigricans DSM 22720]|uniref:Uncharacterized protein n=1 Tax=Enterovibrio nigricans DSM 22720 TaxID=1121868 RepID=A0A1T4W3S1_9GAMM|nr:hypothetical protein SAMN02745132_04724 [Enterovibrio nigricans DSM 22720]
MVLILSKKSVIPQDKYQYIAYKASAPTGIYAPDELVKVCSR